MEQKLLDEFEKIFGDREGARIYFSPGRVNLIGEHTDYNGGHVFPCALTIGTYGAVRGRTDRKLRFYSMNFAEEGVRECSLDGLAPDPDAGWTNYPKGVMWAFEERGMAIPSGMDILLCGTIPNGSGLSSSASVEVLTGFILCDLFGFEVSGPEMAKICQFSENEFNGVNCGIMDQFACAMGKENHAIFLDAASLEYEYVPVQMQGLKLLITNSCKKRGLADSKYNERRAECERALADLQMVIGIETLGDLTGEMFEQYKSTIKDETCRRRARHAVYENQRTIEAVKALRDGDMEAFGRLMNESHRSLSQDYEVTGEEMDVLAEAAQRQKGVLGSRLTGAGFGGCTVTLIREEDIEEFEKNVGREYTERTGLTAEFYTVEIGGGPVVHYQ